jgi:hypothetical protein
LFGYTPNTDTVSCVLDDASAEESSFLNHCFSGQAVKPVTNSGKVYYCKGVWRTVTSDMQHGMPILSMSGDFWTTIKSSKGSAGAAISDVANGAGTGLCDQVSSRYFPWLENGASPGNVIRGNVTCADPVYNRDKLALVRPPVELMKQYKITPNDDDFLPVPGDGGVSICLHRRN